MLDLRSGSTVHVSTSAVAYTYAALLSNLLNYRIGFSATLPIIDSQPSKVDSKADPRLLR